MFVQGDFEVASSPRPRPSETAYFISSSFAGSTLCVWADFLWLLMRGSVPDPVIGAVMNVTGASRFGEYSEEAMATGGSEGILVMAGCDMPRFSECIGSPTGKAPLPVFTFILLVAADSWTGC